MEVTVSKDQVIVCNDGRRAEFFAALLAHPRQFRALADRTREYPWFGDVLVSYLRVIDEKFEALLDDLPGIVVSDEEYMGFCNWMLLQGAEGIQDFLNLSVAEFTAQYVLDGKCHLPSEAAFWYTTNP